MPTFKYEYRERERGGKRKRECMCLRGVIAKVLGYNHEVNEFELLSQNYVHFQTNING